VKRHTKIKVKLVSTKLYDDCLWSPWTMNLVEADRHQPKNNGNNVAFSDKIWIWSISFISGDQIMSHALWQMYLMLSPNCWILWSILNQYLPQLLEAVFPSWLSFPQRQQDWQQEWDHIFHWDTSSLGRLSVPRDNIELTISYHWQRRGTSDRQ
jgi:hypothetical protein